MRRSLQFIAILVAVVVSIVAVQQFRSLGATTITPLTVSATFRTATAPSALVIDNNGSRAYATDPVENTLYVFDVQTGVAVGWIPTGRQPAQVALIAGRAYVSNFTDGTLTEIDLSSAKATKTLEVGGLGLAADAGSGRLFAAGGSQLVVLDTSTDRRVGTITAPKDALLWGVAYDPKTRRLFVTDAAHPRVLVYDTATLALVAQIAIDAPSRFAIAGSGGRIVVASYTDRSPQLAVIDAASASLIARRASTAWATTVVVDAASTAYLASPQDRSITGVTTTAGMLMKATYDEAHLPGAAALHPVSGAIIAVTGGGARPPARPFGDNVQVVQP